MDRRGMYFRLGGTIALTVLLAGCGGEASTPPLPVIAAAPAIWKPTGRLQPSRAKRDLAPRLKITAVNSVREAPVFAPMFDALPEWEALSPAAEIAVEHGPSLSAPAPEGPPVEVAVETMPAIELKQPVITAERPAAPAPAMLRSPQMDVVAQQAEEKVRSGWRLAERGAILSARSEFIQALRLLAQGWDAHTSSRTHSEALSNGLTALEEVEDFMPRGARLEGNLDTARIISAHQTPVLHDSNGIVEVVARQRYYAYAQEQLGIAAHSERAASLALYGLGRIHTAVAQDNAPMIFDADSKAAAFHQAALAADPENFMSANELAVVAAKHGQYESARALLLSSVRVAPQVTTWQNLAQVHRLLGEVQLADMAAREAEHARSVASAKGQGAGGSVGVRWVAAEKFATTARPSLDMRPAQQQQFARPNAAPVPPRNPAMTRGPQQNSSR